MTHGVYWWNDRRNFGDAMTPMLIERLFGVRVVWAPLETAELVALGSVLQWVAGCEHQRTTPLTVWGSGYMEPTSAPVRSPLIHHAAVRGVLSARHGQVDGAVLGDPGLLVSRVVDPPFAAKHPTGLVLHWTIKPSDPWVQWISMNFPDIHVINPRDDPEAVISQISECEFILSCSLHGLIVADSYLIPNQWVAHPIPLSPWKFADYYSNYSQAESIPLVLDGGTDLSRLKDSVTRTYRRPGISEIQEAVFNRFPF